MNNRIKFVDKNIRIGQSKRIVDSNGFLSIKDNKLTRADCIFNYLAKDLGEVAKDFEPNEIVSVFRPASEVFKDESLNSFNNIMVTDDHPSEMLSPSNAQEYAKGWVIDGVHQDGDYMVGDVMITDQKLMNKVLDGKVELSNGYYSVIEKESGVSPKGEPYQFKQTNITGNHLAVVAAGRAGHTCKLSDAAIEQNTVEDNTVNTKTYMKDGADIVVSLDGLNQDVLDYIAHLDTTISSINTLNTEKETLITDTKTALDKALVDNADVATKLEEANKANELLSTELNTVKADNEKLSTDYNELKDSIDTLTKERVSLLQITDTLETKIETKDMSNTEIKKAIVAASYKDSDIDVEKASVETLDALISVINKKPAIKQGKSTLRDALNDSLVKTNSVKGDKNIPIWKQVRQAKIDNQLNK